MRPFSVLAAMGAGVAVLLAGDVPSESRQDGRSTPRAAQSEPLIAHPAPPAGTVTAAIAGGFYRGTSVAQRRRCARQWCVQLHVANDGLELEGVEITAREGRGNCGGFGRVIGYPVIVNRVPVGADGSFSYAKVGGPRFLHGYRARLSGRFTADGRTARGRFSVRGGYCRGRASGRFQAELKSRPRAPTSGVWDACLFPEDGTRIGTYEVWDWDTGCTTARAVGRAWRSASQCQDATCDIRGWTCAAVPQGAADPSAQVRCTTPVSSSLVELVILEACEKTDDLEVAAARVPCRTARRIAARCGSPAEPCEPPWRCRIVDDADTYWHMRCRNMNDARQRVDYVLDKF